APTACSAMPRSATRCSPSSSVVMIARALRAMTTSATAALAVSASLALILPFGAAAASYPEVWGREIAGTIRYLAAEGGDVDIAIAVSARGQALADGGFSLEGFFAGVPRRSSFAEFEAVYRKLAESPRGLGTFSNTGRIGFADGSVIAVESLIEQRDDR